MLGLALYLRMWRRSKPYDPRTGKRAGGVLRVMAYGLFVSLVVGVIAGKKAQADTTEAMRGLSRDLMALADVLGDGSSLRINGETIHVAVTSTSKSVEETLDRFQKHCEENPSVLGQEWTKLTGAVSTAIPAKMEDLPAGAPSSLTKGVVKMGTFRSGDENEGIVVCLVRSESSASDLVTALQEFSRTQDLGALGKMRYAYAKRARNGTQVMTAWTDDHFSFTSLAPASAGGDAPGSDSAIVPRLPDSQRLLTAEVVGTSYAVRVYAAPGNVAQAIATYDTLMRERGFIPIRDEARPNERGYLQGGLFITMVAEPSDKGVTVSFAELGSNVGTPTAMR